MNELIKKAEAACSTHSVEHIPAFQPGDTINVHVKIKEGNKERVQQFEGIVIKRRGDSLANATFSVRKISHGVGVERTFALVSPSIEKIEIKRYGAVRRARLYYLRDRYGKSAKVKERRLVARKG